MTGGNRVLAAVSRHAPVFLGLLLTNPVVYDIGCSFARFSPDSIKYVTLARAMARELDLYLFSFGHVDLGQVLPPLYPSLIAIGSAFSNDLLAVAEIVSSLASIVAVVPLYLFLARATSRLIGAGTLLLIQISGFYLEQALLPLTEATFICVSAWGLLLLDRASRRGAVPGTAFLAGATSAGVFLARQVGVVFVGFALGTVALEVLRSERAARSTSLRRAAAFVVGLGVVLAPYAAALFVQTGQSPLTQTFRKGLYGVHATPEDLQVIDRLRLADPGSISQIYAERRKLRRLDPDASEMYTYLLDSGDDGHEASGVFGRWGDRLRDSPRRLVANLGHVESYLGIGWFGLFVASFSMLFFDRRASEHGRALRLTCAWTASYLAALSLLTGKVDRYVVVILPFAMIQVACAGFALRRRVEERSRSDRTRRLAHWLPAAPLVVGAVFAPVYFWNLDPQPKTRETHLRLGAIRQKIAAGEPVFSLTQLEAYLVGGTFRVLPNDSLDRIAEYGRRTGVRWLLVRRDAAALQEAQLYDNAPWYLDWMSRRGHEPGVRLRAETADGALALYEFEVRRTETPSPVTDAR
jgi:4-amino-4-deoxy-L-arabinose transferase-like glycosyltransferase